MPMARFHETVPCQQITLYFNDSISRLRNLEPFQTAQTLFILLLRPSHKQLYSRTILLHVHCGP